jgi:hypothetical protein
MKACKSGSEEFIVTHFSTLWNPQILKKKVPPARTWEYWVNSMDIKTTLMA